MKKIVIFASGNGSNAEQIIRHLHDNSIAKVALILCNKEDAFIFERAKRLGVECQLATSQQIKSVSFILPLLDKINPSLIVLAGFLLKIPDFLVQKYPNTIVNIHPALLPKYGGKGMYGMNVHRAVVENGESESGITIHYVNENYDEGGVIFQCTCALTKEDSPEKVAEKVHELEHLHYPRVIESLLK